MIIKPALVIILLNCFAITNYAQNRDSFTDSRDGKVYQTVKIGDQIWMAENLQHYMEKYFEYGTLAISAGGDYYYTYMLAKEACPNDWHLPLKAEFLLADCSGMIDPHFIKAKHNEFWISDLTSDSNIQTCEIISDPNPEIKIKNVYEELKLSIRCIKNDDTVLPVSNYYENGNLYSQGNYLNGRNNGEWKYFYENGQMLGIINYLNGQAHGLFIEYDQEGNILKEKIYQYGKCIQGCN